MFWHRVNSFGSLISGDNDSKQNALLQNSIRKKVDHRIL